MCFQYCTYDFDAKFVYLSETYTVYFCYLQLKLNCEKNQFVHHVRLLDRIIYSLGYHWFLFHYIYSDFVIKHYLSLEFE